MTIPTVFPDRPIVAVACGAVLGEAPAWDGRTGTLYWVDIKRNTLFEWRPDGNDEPRRHDFGEPVAFAKLTADPGTLIVGLKTAITRFDARTGISSVVLRPEPDKPGNRLNDAGVGPDGSLYFGSMDDAETDPTGAFYHWSERGLARFGEPAVVTNGPSVDGERRLVYTADSQKRAIFVSSLLPDGTPGGRRPFATIAEGLGLPDGLTLDAEGCLWVCHFGGSRITRYDPAGRPMLVVPMPTSKITKIAFGGPDLETIYVTTASIGLDRETDLQAGHLFSFKPGVRGLASEPCRMGS